MKVMIGEFVTESNANIPDLCTLDHYDLGYGKDCIMQNESTEVFLKERMLKLFLRFSLMLDQGGL